jgi:4-aminobutyrate aminotransferase-like enzyme
MSIQHEGETRANALRVRQERILGRGQSTYTPSLAVIEQAEGSRLWTLDGRELIDFAAGVLVANLGHCHPRFEEYFIRYRGRLPRTAYNLLTGLQVEAEERLVASLGYPKAQKMFWAASGSEGIQKAMWSAQHRYPDRPIIVASRGGFHGKKGLAADVTGESSPNPNVRWISFPMDDGRPSSFYEAELAAITEAHAGQIALLITEPYLGAKGSYHPPKWYHQLLQEWCETNEIAFIFDEVQSCHGRTGNMYAFESYDVEPDLVVLGKGLGNGVPGAAVIGRADLIDALDFGEASDTFSGTPDICAAVCAALDVFDEEQILAHVRGMAPLLAEKLTALKDRFPFVKAIRGEGMVYGIEMKDKETAERCVLEAYYGNGMRGVHFLGPLAGKVLRVSPPLVISADDLQEAFGLIHEAWQRI